MPGRWPHPESCQEWRGDLIIAVNNLQAENLGPRFIWRRSWRSISSDSRTGLCRGLHDRIHCHKPHQTLAMNRAHDEAREELHITVGTLITPDTLLAAIATELQRKPLQEVTFEAVQSRAYPDRCLTQALSPMPTPQAEEWAPGHCRLVVIVTLAG
jgi:hypothetical protein